MYMSSTFTLSESATGDDSPLSCASGGQSFRTSNASYRLTAFLAVAVLLLLLYIIAKIVRCIALFVKKGDESESRAGRGKGKTRVTFAPLPQEEDNEADNAFVDDPFVDVDDSEVEMVDRSS